MVKIAAYCRVSTDRQDQANSFISQQRYFREYIQRNPEWELYDIYADEGVSGTNTYKRAAFNRMMQDARLKCFDLIITKEVSRFSRNILDAISYTRELKRLGIGVVFMNDGLNTLSPDAELRLSIMGSIAQEESRKTSERVKWGQLRQMERGVVFGRSMLGYDVIHGRLSINREGAEIVKRIFYQYGIEKKGTTAIARALNEDGMKTAAGNTVWKESCLLKILKNEKYAGDLIQKKTITPDYLTHEKKYNHGEEKFVIIRNHHEAIITRDLWDTVQREIALRRRVKSSNAHSEYYPLSGKIVCGECGASFVLRTKKRRDGSFYKTWACLTAVREGTRKTTGHGSTVGCSVGKRIRDDLARDMVKSIISTLDIDRKKLTEDLVRVIMTSISAGTRADDTIVKLERQEQNLRKKKMDTIDAYISGVLTKEELIQMKSVYDRELERIQRTISNNKESDAYGDHFRKMYEILTSVLSGEIEFPEFCKIVLEYMKVYRDGTVTVKLKCLNTVWKFQLIK